MKILFVLGGLSAGGTEKTVHMLAHHRQLEGDKVFVAALSGTPNSSYLKYSPDISVLCPSGYENANQRRPMRLFRRITFIRQLIKETKPDLIVSFLSKVNIAAIISSLGLNIPIIISERNNPLEQNKSFLVPSLMRILYPLADCIVMQTGESCALLSPKARKKSLVIPNAVKPYRTTKPNGAGGNRIVAAGRLTHQKGFDLLIDAFAVVASSIPDASLVIYGAGKDQEDLQKQIERLNLANRAKLAGLSDQPQSWVSAGDIFVLPSRFEGFPNVLLEALSAGLPVIAFDCAWGPADILEDGKDGLLVKAGDTTGLAQAIERVIKDKDLRQHLAEEGSLKSRKFSVESVFKRWDEVFSKAKTIR
jgi:glycosyltransferase involved in cell wall biosynthesis